MLLSSEHYLRAEFFFLCLFIFERETEHEQGRGRERGRETQNLKQAPGSELSAQNPLQGLNASGEIMT